MVTNGEAAARKVYRDRDCRLFPGR